MNRIFPLIAMTLAALAYAPADAAENPMDPYLWLEEVEGKPALDWVEAQNARSLPRLEAVAGFTEVRAEAAAQLLSADRIATPKLAGGWVYNFWQDDQHLRGLWRRADLASYQAGNPAWQALIDLDALAKVEQENWVWKGANCLQGTSRCLIFLSRGGKDAVVLREYDVAAKGFVADGFAVAEAKTWVDWQDQDHLLIGSDFGPGSLTDAGYPRTIRRWRRGTALADAPEIFSVAVRALGAQPAAFLTKLRADHLLIDATSFWTSRLHHLAADGRIVASPLPEDADFKTIFQGRVVVLLRSDWRHDGRQFSKGSLVGYPIDRLVKDGAFEVEAIYAPSPGAAVTAVAAAGDRLYLTLLRNVEGVTLALHPDGRQWRVDEVALPGAGTVDLVASDLDQTQIFVRHEGFLSPDSLYLVEGSDAKKVAALPERFDASRYITEQRFATSKDGTRVPYFLVHRRDMVANSDNPTWLYGYGGFEVAITPFYLGPAQQAWLAAGGVYAIANIRGGGEFGPAWHQAALLEHRQRAFDDFYGVAEHLIATKVTNPRRLGISGRSNGGLLMGVALTQRPELWGAVLIGVPLLDMLRYHKLLAGASWIGEYGDPEDPKMRQVLLSYSPYHNLDAGAEYPQVFLYTSTKDDRVHPGHARKLAARLVEIGKPVLYYENTEGGHAGVANPAQAAYRMALEFAYMKSRLMNGL